MTYQETLDFLFKQLPMYQREGKSAFKKDLTNIIAVCNELGNPEKKIKTVHIAGTNGKGSTAHMLSSIFQEAGYKTGLYTSPHLKDFRERIKINGELISENEVVSFVQNYTPLFAKIQPSFFEWTVALAFHYFEKEKVDVAIIETGLGGRLDSTNIISPELSIITNISLDHVDMLGNTLAEIAAEKAGIIKK
ncbi:MAG: bifunctional folylpolyglutamate synthase/dihydrofolate synthase, partial [Flavobacteriales bacterium]|nr:bifunctional folylpolyglutamate synthase/dihydrofolate synthase [Flavobacteriales bacterium]